MNEDTIKKIVEEVKDDYRGFAKQCRDEDLFYDLEFPLAEIKGYPPPHHMASARIAIDNASSQIDYANMQMHVPPRKNEPEFMLNATKREKFHRGCWRAMLEGDSILPFKGFKHANIYGVGWYKTMYDGLWAMKQKKGESDEAFADRLEKWRKGKGRVFPFSTRIVHPTHAFPDRNGEFFIEITKVKVRDVKALYESFKTDKADKEEVEWIEWWRPTEYCYLCDGEIVKELSENPLTFIPYDIMESGLGYESGDYKPEKRWRGLLHGFHDALTTESQIMYEFELGLRQNLFPQNYFTADVNSGLPREAVERAADEWDERLGAKNVVEPGVKRETANPVQFPTAIPMLVDQMQAQIEKAMPRVAAGERPTGADSGYMVAVLAGMARIRWGPLLLSAQRAFANINKKHLIMVEEFPEFSDGITVWGRIGTQPFDVTLTPDDIDGYYVNEVKLSSIAPEEESRKLHDGREAYMAGLISKRLWQEKYGGVDDPEADRIQMLREKIEESPEVMASLVAEMLGQPNQILGPTGEPINLGNQGNPPPPSQSGMTGKMVRPVIPGSREEVDLVGRQINNGVLSGEPIAPRRVP